MRINLKPSLWLASALGLGHAFALAAAWLSLEGVPRYLVLCGIALSAAACLAESLHRTPRSAVGLEVLEDGRASWKDRHGSWHEGRLGDEHFVTPVLVVMGIDQARGGRKWVVLAADSGHPDDLRRLRVWLRWHREDVGDAARGDRDRE